MTEEGPITYKNKTKKISGWENKTTPYKTS